MAEKKIRVLLADDSPSVRAVLRRFLHKTPDIEVAGEASDGERAVALVLELQPQVVLMDLQMPVMDGYTAIERIMRLRPTPILVLTSRANRNQMQTAFEAMRRGAIEVLPKPEETTSWQHLATTLPDTIRSVSRVARPARRRERRPPPRPRAVITPGHRLRWLAVGASTGGPAAVRELLDGIPVDAPVSVLVVQHISPGFEVGLADWLQRELPLDVRLARDGEVPPPGAVRLAPGGFHLLLEPGGDLRLDSAAPPRQGHRPSVDELLLSCARSWPDRSAGVLLTGMGSDGVEGLTELKRRGGLTLVQDEASSVVFGMPRVALERGASEIALPPREIALTLARSWTSEAS